MNTRLSIQGERFLINGMPTYSEIPDCAPEYHGLLMNARFVQGIFDDQANPERFVRFGANRWDPNTGKVWRTQQPARDVVHHTDQS